jgi:hypothetical protein
MTSEMIIERWNGCSLLAKLTEADLDRVTGGASDQTALSQLISTVLKDLHDVRSSIIRNVAG